MLRVVNAACISTCVTYWIEAKALSFAVNTLGPMTRCNIFSGILTLTAGVMQGRNAQMQDSANVANLAAQTLIRQYSEECDGLVPYVKDLIRTHNLMLKGTSANDNQSLLTLK